MGLLMLELANSETRRTNSAKKIAEYVLRDPQAVIDMPISVLAAKVGISEPTVNRFCTGLGLKGFPDFKLRLATEIARRKFHISKDIDPDDSCTDMIEKVFESAHACLNSAMEGLDAAIVDDIAVRLCSARSIVICGQGASSPVALDAQHKLMRFNIPVIAHLDNLNQRMAAAGLGAGDYLLCISYTGRTIPILEIAEIGRNAGATLIGITSADSPLATICNRVLAVESSENTDVYTPMTSRIAQLTLVDVLATRLAVHQPKGFSDHLQRVKQSLSSTRLA
tara:strand:+ start:49 stop:891 length:843 start_codon:yes stop_codon:yes gene_type:complete